MANFKLLKHLTDILKAFLGVELNDVKNMAGETMRNLLSLGLRYAIVGSNHELMKQILDYASGIKQILHINIQSVCNIAENQDTEMMIALVQRVVQIRRFKASEEKACESLMNVAAKVVFSKDNHLLLSTFIIATMQSSNRMDKECFYIIAKLQNEMDFENLIRFLVVDGYTDELFELLSFTKLNEDIRTKIILVAFQVIIELEAMTLGMKLFSLYET